ncbi:MFS transporter [Neotabrizicola shimadae]|uniref:MFS transporter n=1 Tax=Neotabrizicola shimadae TaxID=2807096 RepID=A0A8G0ZYF1_9RHOB|nr:MFS transporter [Neotabrizicola shimadae]QYZ71392.1 MFS transporter [Neotabrizicola shimadae]
MRAALTVMAIWAAGLGAAAQFGKISVLYDVLGAAYPDQAGVGIALMVSVVGMVGLVFGTTAGILVTRIGPRRAMLAALVLGAAVSVVQSWFPPFGVMMASRVLEGVSHLAIVVVGPTAIAAVAPPARQGLALSLWSTFFGLTYAVLFAVAPPLVGAAGPSALFLAHAGWMLAMAVILAVLMPRDPAKAPPVPGGWLRRHMEIYASPRIAAPATGFVCYTVTYVALLTLLPGAVSEGWGQAVGVAMPLVSIAVSLSLGVWLLGRMSAVRVVQTGFAAALVGGLALVLGWGVGWAELTGALMLAGALGLVQGASFAAIAQLNTSDADRAGASGAIAQLGNLGTTTGTPLLAFLLVKAGLTGLGLFILGFSALGIAIHAVQARRRAVSG